jgi:hypothetical protein
MRKTDTVDKLHAREIDFRQVRVYRRENSSTYYTGLRVCGSVWTCPVCAAKVSERRKAKLQLAVDTHRAGGGGVSLLTLTVPHTPEHLPFELVDQVLRAFRSMGQGRNRWKQLIPGYIGFVRTLEVTHGSNGWHPHIHLLLFTESSIDLVVVRDLISSLWSRLVQKVGLLAPSEQRGCTLQDGSSASHYLTKWHIADEITKSTIKEGRQGGRTPWQLLADSMTGDKQAGRLFVDFSKAFKHRSQLQWSRGLIGLLESLYGVDLHELNAVDQELAAETVECKDRLVATIATSDWKLIRFHSLQGRVLEILRSYTHFHDDFHSDSMLDNLLLPYKQQYEERSKKQETFLAAIIRNLPFCRTISVFNASDCIRFFGGNRNSSYTIISEFKTSFSVERTFPPSNNYNFITLKQSERFGTRSLQNGKIFSRYGFLGRSQVETSQKQEISVKNNPHRDFFENIEPPSSVIQV